MNSSCIFCKIIKREIPANIIDENDHIIVIEDITPKAPIHYLMIPKKHIVDVAQLEPADEALAGKLMMMAQALSQKDERHRSFRLVNNNGAGAGQSVFHIHIHFLAGQAMDF